MADDDSGDDVGFAGLSPEFQAMIGGMQGHTERFANMLEQRAAAKSGAAAAKKDDEVYFESYEDLAMHEDMLKDGPRVEAYRKAINHHGKDWAASGATVIDVGAGTGVLSVFCAKAGARKVIAVEASRLAHFTRKIAEANAPPGAIEVRECRAEDLVVKEDELADVVVSEWMGYCLLFENMLPSVLSVRDRCMKPGGLMLPSRCKLFMAPLEDTAWRESKVGFWKQVHDVDMSAIVPVATSAACAKPQHRLVPKDGLLGDPIELLNLDLQTCRETDLKQFEAQLNFELPAGRRLDGMVTWFECEFGSAGWLLSTSSAQPDTHWRQTAFYLREPLEGGGGVSVTGRVIMELHEEFTRGYRVTLDICAPGRTRRLEKYELR